MDLLPSVFLNPTGEETSEMKPQSIFSKYDSMKDKNAQIKKILLQKLDHDSSKTRLLSTVDFEKGRLNLSVLESAGTSVQGHSNYKSTNFSFDLDQVPLFDKMDLHKQTRDGQ
jgi:hypothetical protein